MPRSTRRRFLQSAAVTGAGFWVAGRNAAGFARQSSPNEKLNIGVVGCGGRGAGDIAGVKSENIVALCDVDERRAGETFEKYPKAVRYRDFRKMLETERSLDAVVVATPDHVHAAASIMAMRLGKHVYCEKPLTHSVYEARLMRQVAADQGVATQMGNQGHANHAARQAVEVVRSGALGQIREVHVWTDRPIWPQQIDRPTQKVDVPAGLAWDVWLGPAPKRPYHPAYIPFKWRGWWDFGTGALGDMACHNMDMAYWALDLRDPISVEAEVSHLHPETAPQWSKVRYEFAARGKLSPTTVIWYDGGKKPPASLVGADKLPKNGSILIGEEGTLYVADAYGGNYTLLPEEKFADFDTPEPSIPRSPGHHREWILACKGGPAAMSNFNYSGPFAETVLLGNVAIRAGRKIAWDAENLRVKGMPEAARLIRRPYRDGWTL